MSSDDGGVSDYGGSYGGSDDGDDGWISEDGGGDWISEDDGNDSNQSPSDQDGGEEAGEGSGQEEGDEEDNTCDHEGGDEDEDNQNSDPSGGSVDEDDSVSNVESEEDGEDSYKSAPSDGDDEDEEDGDDEDSENSFDSSMIQNFFRNGQNSDEDSEKYEWSTNYCDYYEDHGPVYDSHHFHEEGTFEEEWGPDEGDYSDVDFFPSDEDYYESLEEDQQDQETSLFARSARLEVATADSRPERSVSILPKVRSFMAVARRLSDSSEGEAYMQKAGDT